MHRNVKRRNCLMYSIYKKTKKQKNKQKKTPKNKKAKIKHVDI